MKILCEENYFKQKYKIQNKNKYSYTITRLQNYLKKVFVSYIKYSQSTNCIVIVLIILLKLDEILKKNE
jgi:hypothetical protein